MTSPTDPTTPSTTGQSAGPNQALRPGSSPLNTALFSPGAIVNPGVNINNIGTGLGVPSLTPPPLKTFVYSPEVRIVIGHGVGQFDVSADVVRCTLTRPENSCATVFFTLHNKDLRYTPPIAAPPFSRMDRIVVYMKKTDELQVFSGYLDEVPYKQLYPGEVNFKATCTLKRLMHTWWNPALPASQSLLQQLSAAQTVAGDGQNGLDSGLGSMLRRLLVKVGGWNIADIHIQNFPEQFYLFLEQQVQKWQTINAPNVQAFKNMLLGSDTSPGPGAYAGQNPNAGAPGPSVGVTGPIAGLSTTDATSAFYITQIVAACDEKGVGPLVSDNNLGAALTQAGATGEASGGPMQNPNNQKAWQQVQQTGLNLQQSNRSSDGAILGVATALVETGAGTAIRNLYNPAVPGSDGFPNDGPGTNGTSCGIMQQQNYAEWGNLAQRMNPKQAAGMFFEHLVQIQGWREMDPGSVCQMIQRSANPAAYSAAIPLATTLVQGYRTGSAGQLSSTTIPSAYAGASGSTVPAAASAASAAAAGSGAAPSMAAGALAGASTTGVAGTNAASAVNPTLSTSPQPNSEGAINWARTQLGKPYKWGAQGPAQYDCSGLVSAAFRSIGVHVPPQTDSIRNSVTRVPNASVQRGDLVEPSTGHVVLYTGPTIIEAQQDGVPIHEVPASTIGPPSSWAWVGRPCANGGPNPAAPYNPPETQGPGNPPSAITQIGGGLSGPGSAGSSEGVARNLFSYLFTPAQFAADASLLLPGEKSFLDGQPLIQMISAVAEAGLRCWSSGPDGSFVAWYPDYWGFDGKPAVMRLADIELQDVTINFSDDPLTTHVYIDGDYSMLGDANQMLGWLDTAGVVTVEDTWLFARLKQAAPADLESISGEALMRRFGVRPLRQQAAMAGTHELEFLMACQLFMQKWAEQYQTTISMTFMPELFPGMRVELANHNLQVYVSSVTHVCDYEQGFYTTAVIMAPSSPMGKQLMLSVNTAEAPMATQFGLSDAMRAFTSPTAGTPGLVPPG